MEPPNPFTLTPGLSKHGAAKLQTTCGDGAAKVEPLKFWSRFDSKVYGVVTGSAFWRFSGSLFWETFWEYSGAHYGLHFSGSVLVTPLSGSAVVAPLFGGLGIDAGGISCYIVI